VSQSPNQVASAIMATIGQTVPELSCAIGTPERGIVDACAQQISAAFISQYTTGGMMDINQKSGLELDQWVGQFSFGRLQGSYAEGEITLTVNNVAAATLNIPLGSQFYTTPGLAGQNQTLYFASTQSVTLPAGQYTCTVPVKCTTVGTAGNVPPDSITSQSAALGASTVTNLAAMTGGTNTETDAQLRQRFQDTFLRNISGTRDWYINLALQNNNVARVVAYGPVSLYKTQLAVPASSYTLPVGADVKYVWPNGASCFTGIATSSETFYSPINDFNLSSGAGPIFTTVSSGALASQTGLIVDLEFQYTTACSRNDPANGITNKIDVFSDGSAPFRVTETCVVPNQLLSSSSSSPFYTGNFVRVHDTGTPQPTNYFMRLGSVPVLNFPTSITVGSVVYTQGTHYHLLQGTTSLKGSQYEVAGIEWEASGGPAVGTQMTLSYSYNQLPQLLDATMGASKQICTDVLNHQANYQYITTCLSVEYSRNYAITTVNTAIASRLQIFYQGLSFGSAVILSQLVAAVQQVLGVNGVHVTTSAENGTTYGVRVFNNSTDTVPAHVYTNDFVLLDNQVAAYQGAVTLQVPNIGGLGG
jgi:uncharacterized phage protein gp47/JayE